MPTCPRCVLFALVLGVLAFSGCDTTNPGSNLTDVQGVYTISTLSFDLDQPEAIPNIDVLTGIQGSPVIEIGGDGRALVRFEPLGGASQIVVGDARATPNAVSITASTDAEVAKLRRILLPGSFSLNRDPANTNQLSANLDLTSVNLEAYNPTLYGSLTSVSGRLSISLSRTSN